MGERFAGVVGVGFVWVCVWALRCGEWKEFARLCICRKGERGEALCESGGEKVVRWNGFIK